MSDDKICIVVVFERTRSICISFSVALNHAHWLNSEQLLTC